ncbi:MAG: DUF1569 domain-containing protein [Imperialibacter sp.]|uniref:DUF1569 domain-containing protein n=1 Tax=Imperialibacter sp. TaxID=2038411 RepID=UPI0032EC2925
MKSVFDENVRAELIGRVNTITESSVAQWGKMNVFQMLKHSTKWSEWVLGTHKQVYKQELLGRIFGKMALRSNVKDDQPMKKNIPSGRDFVIKDKTGDVELQKMAWIERITEYEHFDNPDFIHDFFGVMTREEIGIFVYKHSDHHLRQFGA